MSFVAWSGRGYMVALINLVAAGIVFGGWYLAGLLPGTRLQIAIAFALWGVLSGAAVFFWARAADAAPPSVLIDRDSGREVAVKNGAGTFGYIPSRYSAYLNPVAGIVLAYLVLYTDVLTRH